MRGGLVTILATVVACGVVACGGDDGSDATGAAKEKPSAVDATRAAKPRPSAVESTADGVTPPGGPRKMLGDFGRPPTRAERAAIAAAVDRYHRAVASDDHARICAQMSRAARRAVGQGYGGSGRCADQIGPLYSGFTDAMRKAVLRARITELRVKGDHAIVIGFIPGPRTIKLPLDRADGTWRYGTFGKWTPRSL